MTDQFPANSHKAAEQQTRKELPAPEERVVNPIPGLGKVERRKKSLARRAREALFAGDQNGLWGYLMRDVLIPAAQNLVTDFVQQGIEKAVYGEVRSPSRGTRAGGTIGQNRTIISYDQYGRQRQTPATHAAASPSRRPAPATRNGLRIIDDIIVPTREHAELIITELMALIESDYACATVSNLNSLINQTSTYVDHAWGWTQLPGADIKRVRDGYLVILPPAEDLRQ